MTEAQVKARIGPKNWTKFRNWMVGQTLGVNEDGSTNFYQCDVERFAQGLKTGDYTIYD